MSAQKIKWDIRHFRKDGTEFHPGDPLNLSEESKKEIDEALLRAMKRMEERRAKTKEGATP